MFGKFHTFSKTFGVINIVHTCKNSDSVGLLFSNKITTFSSSHFSSNNTPRELSSGSRCSPDHPRFSTEHGPIAGTADSVNSFDWVFVLVLTTPRSTWRGIFNSTHYSTLPTNTLINAKEIQLQTMFFPRDPRAIGFSLRFISTSSHEDNLKRCFS